MSERRPDIPAEIRRRVLIEAGHRCAIPTCRYIEVDVHHITPYAECQKHEYENLIALCPNCHRRAGRGEIDRKSQRAYKANLRFAHDKFSQFEIDTLFHLNQLPNGLGLVFPEYLFLLVKRLTDAEYIGFAPVGGFIVVGGAKITPDVLMAITPKGRAFIEELGLDSDS